MPDEPTQRGRREKPGAGQRRHTRRAPSRASPCILLAERRWCGPRVAGSWTALVVVVACVVDGLADGIFAWLRARASFAAGSATDSRDAVLVREFLRTYVVVIGAQAVVAYMVFGGLLLKPGGEAPDQPGAAFATWQYWAVVAGLVVMRGPCTGGTSCAAGKPS